MSTDEQTHQCERPDIPMPPIFHKLWDLHETGMSILDALRATRVERARLFVPKKRTHPPVVYYMRMDRLVKIGTTTSIGNRVSVLSPQGVLALEWGSYDLEKERHQEFEAHHSHAEWYWLRDDLLDHVIGLRQKPKFSGSLTLDEWLDVWGGWTVAAR